MRTCARFHLWQVRNTCSAEQLFQLTSRVVEQDVESQNENMACLDTQIFDIYPCVSVPHVDLRCV